MSDLLEIGEVVKPHGLRGEVVVRLITNHPEARFAPGAVLDSDGGDLEVLAGRPHQGRWLVLFAGVADRNAAERLRGRVLRAAPLEGDEADGALWVHELVGAEVVDTAGHPCGVVKAVESNPASDLLVLEGERLVPLTFVVSHEPGLRGPNAVAGRVVIDPPPGLLD